jgi:hypothetical protein
VLVWWKRNNRRVWWWTINPGSICCCIKKGIIQILKWCKWLRWSSVLFPYPVLAVGGAVPNNQKYFCSTSFSGLLTFTYFLRAFFESKDRTRCYKSRPIIASCPTMAFASSPDHPTLHPHWWHSPAALPCPLRSNSRSVVSAASILDISWFVTFH